MAACEATGLVPIAVDGKSARAAKRNTATGCLTVVSAWATENRLTLGQVAVPDGSNETGMIEGLPVAGLDAETRKTGYFAAYTEAELTLAPVDTAQITTEGPYR